MPLDSLAPSALKESPYFPLKGVGISAFLRIKHSDTRLRFILHSKVVSQLMHPEVPAGDIFRFIWEHLVNDVRNVSTSLERSEDEVLLLIHLVLSEIMNRSTMSKSIN